MQNYNFNQEKLGNAVKLGIIKALRDKSILTSEQMQALIKRI